MTARDFINRTTLDTLIFNIKNIMKAKDGNWIKGAVKGMRKDKPCTGAKFGSSSCPAGSKRYNLAKTFKSMSKKKK